MPGSHRWYRVKTWAFVLSLALIVSGTLIYLYPAAPSRVVMATGFKGTGFYYYGRRYQEAFARSKVELELREAVGSVENLKLLEDPASDVQIAFVLGGVSDSDRAPSVLSLGTVYNVAFWIFYASPDPIDHISQLQGKRIAVGPEGSGIRFEGDKVLAAAGITEANTKFYPLGGQAAIEALKNGKVDAVWTTAPPELPAIQSILRIPNVRLLNFRNADAYSRMFPELVRLDLPQGVLDLAGNFPATDVPLIATKVHVLVRSDLHPAILNVLLQTLTKVHGRPGVFQRGGEFPAGSDAEYQMAPAAVDFYRNGPSFLHRHLPLWLTVHVQRVLILAATAIPLLFLVISGEPQVYRWIIRERTRAAYRRLKGVESQLQTTLSLDQVARLTEEIEKIDAHAGTIKMPGRYANSFFSSKVHINLIRARLAARSVELAKQATVRSSETSRHAPCGADDPFECCVECPADLKRQHASAFATASNKCLLQAARPARGQNRTSHRAWPRSAWCQYLPFLQDAQAGADSNWRTQVLSSRLAYCSAVKP